MATRKMTPRKTTPKQSPVVELRQKMDFCQALDMLLAGRAVTKLEWNDDREYMCIFNNTIHIHKAEDNTLHPMMVGIGDIAGEDWVVL